MTSLSSKYPYMLIAPDSSHPHGHFLLSATLHTASQGFGHCLLCFHQTASGVQLGQLPYQLSLLIVAESIGTAHSGFCRLQRGNSQPKLGALANNFSDNDQADGFNGQKAWADFHGDALSHLGMLPSRSQTREAPRGTSLTLLCISAPCSCQRAQGYTSKYHAEQTVRTIHLPSMSARKSIPHQQPRVLLYSYFYLYRYCALVSRNPCCWAVSISRASF